MIYGLLGILSLCHRCATFSVFVGFLLDPSVSTLLKILYENILDDSDLNPVIRVILETPFVLLFQPSDYFLEYWVQELGYSSAVECARVRPWALSTATQKQIFNVYLCARVGNFVFGLVACFYMFLWSLPLAGAIFTRKGIQQCNSLQS